MARTDTPGPWAPGKRRLTAGLVMTITLMAFESLAVATVLPVVSRHLGDVRLYGWVFSAFFLASLLGIVTGGSAADRSDVRTPMSLGLVAFAAGLLVGGAAPDMPVLVAGRVVQGFGAGMVLSSGYVAISRGYEHGARPKMFAILSSAWVVPGLIGPALAAQVAELAGWRWVFLGLLPLVGVAALVAVPAVGGMASPEGQRPTSSPVTSALGVAVGAGCALAGLGSGAPAAAVPLILGGGAILAFSLRRLTPPGTLRASPGMPAAVLARGLLTFAYFAGDAYVPLELTSVRHTSTTFAGLTLTVATITWTAGSWVQARVVHERGPRDLVAGGLLVVVAGLAGMACVLSHSVPVWVAPLAWGFGGFGIGVAYSPTSLIALGWASPGKEGEASAAVQLADVLGTALGTGVSGAAIALAERQGAAVRSGLLGAFVAAGVVAVLAAGVARRLPATAEAAPTAAPT